MEAVSRIATLALVLLIALLARPEAVAPGLDAQSRAMLDPLREQALHPGELIERLHLPPDAVVADLGAGPGFLSLPLARAVPRGRVIATDVDPRGLDVLRRRAEAAGLHNLETRQVAPDTPGLAPGSVDVALLCQLDHYLKDRAAWFAALRPALKPGGRVVVVNYVRHRDAALAAARAAGLTLVEEWAPSPPFYVAILQPW
jgi:SAM-dependent methyltransferase